MSVATQLLMEDVGSQDNVTVCTLLFGVIPDMLYDYRVHSIWKWQADKSYLYESSVGLIWDVINCQEVLSFMQLAIRIWDYRKSEHGPNDR